MADEPVVGEWAVIGAPGFTRPSILVFEAAVVEKIAQKTVRAKAHYKIQHDRANVIGMPDEASARLFAEQVKSAYAEASRREYAAWDSYKATIGQLVKAASAKDPS